MDITITKDCEDSKEHTKEIGDGGQDPKTPKKVIKKD